MPKKAKIDCKFKALGGHGAMLKLTADAPDFGKIKCDIHYELVSDRMTEIVIKKGKEAEVLLDGMEVDATNSESVAKYIMACGLALNNLMNAVQAELQE